MGIYEHPQPFLRQSIFCRIENKTIIWGHISFSTFKHYEVGVIWDHYGSECYETGKGSALVSIWNSTIGLLKPQTHYLFTFHLGFCRRQKTISGFYMHKLRCILKLDHWALISFPRSVTGGKELGHGRKASCPLKCLPQTKWFRPQ